MEILVYCVQERNPREGGGLPALQSGHCFLNVFFLFVYLHPQAFFINYFSQLVHCLILKYQWTACP